MPALNIKQWLGSNERSYILPTDKWYLDFANKVFPLVKASPLFKNEDHYTQADAAIGIALYFQDVIAQNGGWKIIPELLYELYNTHLPFYHLTDEYIADEINKEDIAFILWTQKARPISWDGHPYTLFNPFDKDLLALSQATYDLMDKCYEEAPISEEASNGLWVMGPDLLEMPTAPLPEITPETTLTTDVELCLEYSGGKPLLYFATYQELCTFFVEVLKWENTPSSLLPDLKYKKEFVIYANARGMLIGHNIAAYFCEEHNPMYDAQRTVQEGYKIFCKPGLCPYDLVKYGMIRGLLPDVELPFHGGKELLHENWDFLSRFYLCEFYDGE